MCYNVNKCDYIFEHIYKYITYILTMIIKLYFSILKTLYIRKNFYFQTFYFQTILLIFFLMFFVFVLLCFVLYILLYDINIHSYV